MSYWTHVLGSLQVSPVPCRTQAECQFIIDSILHHLPIVSGSEENMYIQFHSCGGFDTSSSYDELEKNTDKHTGYFKNFEIQTKYIITIQGDFRDTYFNDQLKQMQKWLNRISKRLDVYDTCIHLYSNNGESYCWNEELSYNFDKSYIENYLSYLYSEGVD